MQYTVQLCGEGLEHGGGERKGKWRALFLILFILSQSHIIKRPFMNSILSHVLSFNPHFLSQQMYVIPVKTEKGRASSFLICFYFLM